MRKDKTQYLLTAQFKKELKKHHIFPKKSLGQHFLIDAQKVQQIIRFANFPKGALVLEIGSGLGILTKELASKVEVIAVETDHQLAGWLRKKLPNIKVIEEDIREVNLLSLTTSPLYIIGNIPYNITGDIIEWLFNYKHLIKKAVLMLQKELADKLLALPNQKLYSALSVKAQLLACINQGPLVEKDLFYPQPKVNSKVINSTS